MAADAQFVLDSLKQNDPERYLCVLYLPQSIREDVAAIWAFDAEVSRIPELVSEPLPGEIRLQWWRDLIKSGDNVGSGPLAKALMNVISKQDLPRETFAAYLDARIFDLYNDPMPDKGTFEGYLGEIYSSVFQMTALCTGAERSSELADACGHAGMAVGIKHLLSNAARHRAREQNYFPSKVDSYADLSRYEELAETHLKDARHAIGKLPKENRSVFLPISFVQPFLKLMRKNREKILREPLVLSPLHRHLALFRAAVRPVP